MKKRFFSHDENAINDPKIMSMMSVYGFEGYGRFWALVELLRRDDSYKICINKKHFYNGLAHYLRMNVNDAEIFLNDCIYEFELFQSDNEFFWSNSLNSRMNIMEDRSNAKSEAAKIRWNKEKKKDELKQTETYVESIEIKKPISDKPEDKKRDTNENETVAQYPEEVAKLTGLLINLMKKNNPNAKVPDKLDKWHDSIRLMIQNDGYSLDQIEQLIVFSQNDSFWKGNILSTTKLRDKAGTLILQIGRNDEKKPVSKNQRPIINAVLDKEAEEELSHEEIERIRKQAREAEMILRSQNIKNE